MQIPQKDTGSGPWLTVSIGTATAVPAGEQPCTDLILVADRGLYQAKRQGRNRVVPGQMPPVTA
ncbi:diguanylate cyclase [compost metagenome]